MDIKLTDSSIRQFLETPADSETLSNLLSLCGPTFDRITKIGSDYLYEIEVITNRIDTVSAQGIAREASAILSQHGIPGKIINDPYKKTKIDVKSASLKFNFQIDSKLVKRFMAVALENVVVKKSPDKTIEFLESCGQRSINNCIDITNELTLLYGIPSHIFDLDKLASQKLIIRESLAGETLTTLDSQQCILASGDIIIEDGAGRIIDLCGIMGGQVAEVDDHTKNILLIVPIYNAKKVRTTSLYLQKRTLAAQIFEKNPDTELCLPTIIKAIELFGKRASSKTSSAVFDYYPEAQKTKSIDFGTDWINKFTGINIEPKTISSILTNLGFGVSSKGNVITCTVPSWRHDDIKSKEDLAEEIARIYGYFLLPAKLPCVNLPAEQPNLTLTSENKVRNLLSSTGYTEIYNSSLISESVITNNLLDTEKHLKLINALSKDYEFLRISLLPSLLINYKNNQPKAIAGIRIFEIANCYFKKTEDSLPDETPYLGMLSDNDYRTTKGQLENLLHTLGIRNAVFMENDNLPPYYHKSATAEIMVNSETIGFIGHIKPSVLNKLEIINNPVAIEINIPVLVSVIKPLNKFDPPSSSALKSEDITVKSDKPIGSLRDTIQNSSGLIKQIEYLESYENNHTFRVYFQHLENKIEQSEIDKLKEDIIKKLSVS